MSELTIYREPAFLKNLVTKAVEWDKIGENSVKKVRFYREYTSRTRFLADEEEERLRAHCKPQQQPPVINALH